MAEHEPFMSCTDATAMHFNMLLQGLKEPIACSRVTLLYPPHVSAIWGPGQACVERTYTSGAPCTSTDTFDMSEYC